LVDAGVADYGVGLVKNFLLGKPGIANSAAWPRMGVGNRATGGQPMTEPIKLEIFTDYV